MNDVILVVSAADLHSAAWLDPYYLCWIPKRSVVENKDVQLEELTVTDVSTASRTAQMSWKQHLPDSPRGETRKFECRWHCWQIAF